MLLKNIKKKNYDLYGILFLYILFLGVGLFHHEFWMDESHHWLVARDSSSISNLIKNYQYDGHPILWVSSMWVIGKMSTNVIFVQLFHGLLASIVASIFLFKAPFKRGYRVLFIFSYYPLFEYGVLSRNYSITILFLLLFCLSFRKNGKLLLPFIFLGLASNGHLFGMILSILLGTKIMYDKRRELKTHLVPVVIFLILLIFAFITIKAPSDHYFYLDTSKLFDIQRLKSILSVWWKAIVPIPDLTGPNFWNTNLFTSYLKIASIPLVLISWTIPLFLLKKKSGYFLVFYGYAFSIASFCLLTGLNVSQRIGGFLLFSLIIMVWIEKEFFPKNKVIIGMNKRIKPPLLIGFLSVQIIATGIFLVTDVIRPFSNTKNIHKKITPYIEHGTPVYAGLYCNYVGVNNYGDLKMKIISQGDEINYCDWRTLTKNKNKDYLNEGFAYMNSKGFKEMIFLSPYSLPGAYQVEYKVQLIGQELGAMVKNENAYIYLISKNGQEN